MANDNEPVGDPDEVKVHWTQQNTCFHCGGTRTGEGEDVGPCPNRKCIEINANREIDQALAAKHLSEPERKYLAHFGELPPSDISLTHFETTEDGRVKMGQEFNLKPSKQVIERQLKQAAEFNKRYKTYKNLRKMFCIHSIDTAGIMRNTLLYFDLEEIAVGYLDERIGPNITEDCKFVVLPIYVKK